MGQLVRVLVGVVLLASCAQNSTGWVSAGVGPLSSDAQVSYYQAGELKKTEVLAARGGSSYNFRGSVGTQVCIQIDKSQQTAAYKLTIETNVLMAIVISEASGQLKAGGNARYTFAQACS